MNEKIKDLGEKVKGGMGKLNKKTRKLLIIGLVLVVVAAVAIVVIQKNQPYSVLFTEMNSDELSSVLSYLEQNGVRDYRIENNDTVLVPKAQESSLKARLLMEGYPNSGFSYSTYFDKVGALSTESERSTAYLIALQERMGAVIRCLDGVKDAVVTITPGEDRSYVLDSSNVVNASASVIVTMKSGAMLSNQQANAIRKLVARGVQGLEIDRVEIVDNIGNTYSASTSGSTADADASQIKNQLEEDANNKARTQIMAVLEPLFGRKNVSVGVHCNVELSKTIHESTTYELPDWAADGSTNGEGIIGSKVYDNIVIRDEDEVNGGVVGTTSNADLPEYVENELNPDGTERRISTSGQVDYKTDTHKEYVEYTAGHITDCLVAVSINSTTAGSVNVPEMRALIAKAAGINTVVTEEVSGEQYLESKVSIVLRPFYVDELQGTPGEGEGNERIIPDWAIYAAIAGAALFIILLVLILVIRSKKKKKNAALGFEDDQQSVLDGLLAAAGLGQEPMGADVMSLQTEKSMELRKEIRQFADTNPEIAAQMVKVMLRGGDENA